MIKLKLTAEAKRLLKVIPEEYKKPLAEVLQEIKDYPLVGKPLTREFTGYFSFRVGVYRIIYKVNRHDGYVLIMTVEHRSKVYN